MPNPFLYNAGPQIPPMAPAVPRLMDNPAFERDVRVMRRSGFNDAQIEEMLQARKARPSVEQLNATTAGPPVSLFNRNISGAIEGASPAGRAPVGGARVASPPGVVPQGLEEILKNITGESSSPRINQGAGPGVVLGGEPATSPPRPAPFVPPGGPQFVPPPMRAEVTGGALLDEGFGARPPGDAAAVILNLPSMAAHVAGGPGRSPTGPAAPPSPGPGPAQAGPVPPPALPPMGGPLPGMAAAPEFQGEGGAAGPQPQGPSIPPMGPEAGAAAAEMAQNPSMVQSLAGALGTTPQALSRNLMEFGLRMMAEGEAKPGTTVGPTLLGSAGRAGLGTLTSARGREAAGSKAATTERRNQEKTALEREKIAATTSLRQATIDAKASTDSLMAEIRRETNDIRRVQAMNDLIKSEAGVLGEYDKRAAENPLLMAPPGPNASKESRASYDAAKREQAAGRREIRDRFNEYRREARDAIKGGAKVPSAPAEAAPKGPPSGGVPRPSSRAEYEALPSGSEFYDPKGVKRRKP